MVLIALIGQKGCGKTTVSEYLTRTYDFIDYALADPLKSIAKIFGFTDQQLYGSQKDKTEINAQLGICAREFLQKFGTDLCRDQLKHLFPKLDLGDSGIIWIKLMENFIDQHHHTHHIVISDCRFTDEVNAVRNYPNSITIELIRDDVETDEYSGHASETSLSNVDADYQIKNDDSLEVLYSKIDKIIDNYK